MKFVELVGRICFSFIFIISAPNHFKEGTIGYAANAGVPFAHILVPASGVIAFLGGLSILLGLKAKWGTWLIVLFLVPVTLTMHKFWGLADPQATQMQMINFIKNVSMLGGALIIAYHGTGSWSLKQ